METQTNGLVFVIPTVNPDGAGSLFDGYFGASENCLSGTYAAATG